MANSFTVYITAQTVSDSLRDSDARDRALDLLRRARCSRVVLEGYRGGLSVGEDILGTLRAWFGEHGIDSYGGMNPTYGENLGTRAAGIETRQPLFCYSSEDSLTALEWEIRKLARQFDTVVIDDALETSCRCRLCEEGRGTQTWAAFRRSLICGAAERFVAAAREENPGTRVIVKFPQYYDRHQRFGYDAKALPEIFDAVWIGSETRNPNTLDYGFTEPYQGYFNVRWAKEWARTKLESAWFDFYDCNDQYMYDQGVVASLADAPAITLFNYDETVFSSSRIQRLAQAETWLEKLKALSKGPEGVYVIKPTNSEGDGDLFIYDYLGMCGIPCLPALKIEPHMKSVIVPAQALDDPDAPRAIRKALDAGCQVIATFAALQRMAVNPGLLEFFGYTSSGISTAGAEVREIEIDGVMRRTTGTFHTAGDLEPQDAAVLSWAHVDVLHGQTMRVPFITSRALLSGGRAVVWNIGTFGSDAFLIHEPFNIPVKPEWFSIPHRVLHYMRSLATQPLDFTLYLPARVAGFVFAEHLVFVNFTLNRVEVRVDGLPWDRTSLESDSVNTVLSSDIIMIAPQSHAIVRRVRE